MARPRRYEQLLLLVAVLLIGALVRVATFRMILGQGEEVAYPSDGDTAYHLYRTRETVLHFPRVPVFDAWVNWPHGAPCQWSSGYDLLAAGWVRAWGGGDDARGYLLSMLFPIACGLVLIAATVELARLAAPARWRRGVAPAAGLLLALNPAAVLASCFGRTDHHGLEALSAVLLACWSLSTVRCPARAQWRVAASGTLVVAFAVCVFSGGPLYVAIATVSLGLVALFQRSPRIRWGAPTGLVLGGAIAALDYGRAVAVHGELLVMRFPSFLQPGLCVVAGAFLAVAVALSRRYATWKGRAGRFAVAALVLTGCAAAVPGVAQQLRDGLVGWVLHHDAWLATIGEFQPLFGRHSVNLDPLQAGFAAFGIAGVLAIFVTPVVLIVTRRRFATTLVFGTYAVSLLALTLVQSRFARVAAPFAAVVLALAACAAARLTRRLARRWLVAAPLAVAVLLLVVDPAVHRELEIPEAGMGPVQETALALRPTGEVRRGEGAGVLAHWSIGNFVRAIGRRPVVVTGFGTYLDEASFWQVDRVFSQDEGALLQLMESRDLGYLVAGPIVFGGAVRRTGASPFVRGELGQAFFEQLPLAPLLIAGSGVPESGVKHLEHFLPVYAAKKLISGLSFGLPLLWSYEKVRGAELEGTARPGIRVVGRLVFRAWGARYVWQAWTDADPNGRWRMRVPFPSGYAARVISSDPRWSLSAEGGSPASVAVTEAAVRSGDTVRVGMLR